MKQEAEAKAAAERAEAEAKAAAEQAQAVNILQYYRGAEEPALVAHYINEAEAASKHADGTGTDRIARASRRSVAGKSRSPNRERGRRSTRYLHHCTSSLL